SQARPDTRCRGLSANAVQGSDDVVSAHLSALRRSNSSTAFVANAGNATSVNQGLKKCLPTAHLRSTPSLCHRWQTSPRTIAFESNNPLDSRQAHGPTRPRTPPRHGDREPIAAKRDRTGLATARRQRGKPTIPHECKEQHRYGDSKRNKNDVHGIACFRNSS